jgi:hypothetical protein
MLVIPWICKVAAAVTMIATATRFEMPCRNMYQAECARARSRPDAAHISAVRVSAWLPRPRLLARPAKKQIWADSGPKDGDHGRPKCRTCGNRGYKEAPRHLLPRNIYDHDGAKIGKQADCQPFEDRDIAGAQRITHLLARHIEGAVPQSASSRHHPSLRDRLQMFMVFAMNNRPTIVCSNHAGSGGGCSRRFPSLSCARSCR